MRAPPQVPDRVRVLGKEYRLLRTEVPDCYGTCDSWSGEITYDPDLDSRPIEKADTILHEVFHAILFCQGREPCDHEERYVRALSAGLISVLADNPKFAKWLASNHPSFAK